MKEIKFTIQTLSNLMIGGNESGFLIGGIDQHTVMDHDGKPYIPGSSFKGAFRKIIREDNDKTICDIFKDYVDERIKESVESSKNTDMNIDVDKFKKNLKKGVKSESEYMFGVEGYNQSPKLMFSDIHLMGGNLGINDYFSIDAKNSIEEKDNGLLANPRIYKVARKGLIFAGTIRFRNFEKLANDDRKKVQKYVKEQLETAFNDGFYRLGNSKSRGYGHVEVKVTEIDGEKVGVS